MAFRVFILTASDAGSRGEREDKSGPAAQEMLEEAGASLLFIKFQFHPSDELIH